MRSSLQAKISSAMWVMTAVSVLAAAILTGGLLITSHKESIRQQLQVAATTLVALGITHFSELKDFEELNNFIEDALQMDRIDKIIRVYDGSKHLIFTTAGKSYDVLPDTLQNDIKKPVFMTLEGKHRRYESIVMQYEGERSKKIFYLQVAIPLPRYSQVLDYLWWQSLLMLSFLIGFSILLSQWLSRKLLRPVGIISNHLKEMDPAKIDDWKTLSLDPKSGYLKSIADGINLLAERTRISISQLRKMSRFVAHEMRTPLTILRGEAETVLSQRNVTAKDYESVLKSSLEEIERMSEIVNTVLQIGEPSQSISIFQPIKLDIAEWLEENKPHWEKTLDRPIKLRLAQQKIEITSDPKLLFRLIDNLVRNVKNHTPYSSKCSIYLKSVDGKSSIIVADDGPGMSNKTIESLNISGHFSETAGVGLNLSYKIAEIIGVKIQFSNRQDNGLQVEIIFPT